MAFSYCENCYRLQEVASLARERTDDAEYARDVYLKTLIQTEEKLATSEERLAVILIVLPFLAWLLTIKYKQCPKCRCQVTVGDEFCWGDYCTCTA